MDIRAFADDIASAEARYAERAEAREETLRDLDDGGVLAADTPERVAKRLARLGADPETAQALAEGAVPLAPGVEPPPREELAALADADVPVKTVALDAADVIALERLISNSDLISAAFLERGAEVARSVARILVCTERGGLAGYGTGSLVGPRLFLTNNHVLESAEVASRARLEFGYQLGLDGTPAPGVAFKLDPETLFVTDRELDYTLVAVEERNDQGTPLRQYGWNPLIEAEGKAVKGEMLNIVQHPNGEPKQLAMRENQLVDVLEKHLHYRTDTARGSSGAPVFNDQWEVVALHHSGVARKDEQGRKLAVGGGLWAPEMGEHRLDWIANEGVRISQIVAHVKNQKLDGEAARLRAELFDAEPPAPADEGRAVAFEAAAVDVAVAATDGSMSWTIPLEVTVRVGSPSRGA